MASWVCILLLIFNITTAVNTSYNIGLPATGGNNLDSGTLKRMLNTFGGRGSQPDSPAPDATPIAASATPTTTATTPTATTTTTTTTTTTEASDSGDEITSTTSSERSRYACHLAADIGNAAVRKAGLVMYHISASERWLYSVRRSPSGR